MWTFRQIYEYSYDIGDHVVATMHSVNYSDNGAYRVEGVILKCGYTSNRYVRHGPVYYTRILRSEVDDAGSVRELYESGSKLYGLW